MKVQIIVSLLPFLAAAAGSAVPRSEVRSQIIERDEGLLDFYPRLVRRVDKGKGRAQDDPPRANTPTPNDDPEVPLPGRSGWYRDPNTGLTTAFYGDDQMPNHMRHTDRNQQLHPSNRDPMPINTGPSNRPDALRNIPPAPAHPVTKDSRVKDEKPPNMFKIPNSKTQTTVEYRDEMESSGKNRNLNAPPKPNRPEVDHTAGRTHSGTDYRT
jgi:hypothetical protein